MLDCQRVHSLFLPISLGLGGIASRKEDRLIAEGKLYVPVAATYSLSEGKQALAHIQRGGKVLFKIS